MDVYWGKRKFDIIGEGDEPEEIDNSEKKEDKKKKNTKSFIPPLEHTKLFMSNIATDGNHIYFYSEVSRIRMLELNRALEKVNLDLMKKNHGSSIKNYLSKNLALLRGLSFTGRIKI